MGSPEWVLTPGHCLVAVISPAAAVSYYSGGSLQERSFWSLYTAALVGRHLKAFCGAAEMMDSHFWVHTPNPPLMLGAPFPLCSMEPHSGRFGPSEKLHKLPLVLVNSSRSR